MKPFWPPANVLPKKTPAAAAVLIYRDDFSDANGNESLALFRINSIEEASSKPTSGAELKVQAALASL
jgi:hypothetical protein